MKMLYLFYIAMKLKTELNYHNQLRYLVRLSLTNNNIFKEQSFFIYLDFFLQHEGIKSYEL